MAQVKKYNDMDKSQQELYIKLADVIELWAKNTSNNSSAGIKLIHEVMVTLTMAIAAFYLIKKGETDQNDIQSQAGTGDPKVSPGTTQSFGNNN